MEKTDGEEPIGSWETSLASKMMVKLLELWLTPESREKVEEILGYYHPLDRAAMAYALVVYMMTGTKMKFKSAVASQHYKICCQMLKEDMPELMLETLNIKNITESEDERGNVYVRIELKLKTPQFRCSLIRLDYEKVYFYFERH